MKKIFFFLSITFFLSCDRNKVVIAENSGSDSIVYFLNKSLSSEVEKDKILFSDKAFSLLLKSPRNRSNNKMLSQITFTYYQYRKWTKYDNATRIYFLNCKKFEDSSSIAEAMRFRGNFFFNVKIYDSAFYYFSKSEKFYLKLKDRDNYSITSLKKGIVQYYAGDLSGANVSLILAYNFFKNTNDFQTLYNCLNYLGLVSIELKDYHKALIYNNEALKIADSSNFLIKEHQKSVCLHNIGLVYQSLKNYNKSIEYFNLSLAEKSLRKDNVEFYAILIDNLAYSKFKSNWNSNLPNLFYESLTIRDSVGEPANQISSYNHLSEYYAKIKDTTVSLNFSKKALVIANTSKSPTNLIAALKQILLIDTKNSSKYAARYIRINDSLQDIERRNKNIFATIELETDEIRRDRDEIIVSNKNLTFYLVSSFGFLLLLFSIRIFKSSKRLAVLEKLQKDAGQEMFNLILEQQNKVEEGRILEKNRISQEIHDGILGRLFGLRMNLDGLNHRSDIEAQEERIDCVEKLKAIEADVREISHELSREKFVLVSNFVSIVNQLFDDQRKINSAVLNTSVSETLDWDNIMSVVKINLYRVLQECFQNINKYAEAKNITVLFRKDKKGNLTLTITDDGVGFDVEKNSSGIGVNNIITRVNECLGTTEIASEKDKGTRYSIVVPLDHKIVKT